MIRLLRRVKQEAGWEDSLVLELAELLDRGFVERYGCILYSGHEKSAQLKSTREALVDKTGIECFANHIHIIDHVKADPLGQLQQGMAFVRELTKELRRSYPRTRFRLILSHNKHGVIVRFHKLRVAEEWLSDDLEEYKEDSIYVLTVCANRSKY